MTWHKKKLTTHRSPQPRSLDPHPLPLNWMTSNGKRERTSFVATSAPALRRRATTSLCPWCTAEWRGVWCMNEWAGKEESARKGVWKYKLHVHKHIHIHIHTNTTQVSVECVSYVHQTEAAFPASSRIAWRAATWVCSGFRPYLRFLSVLHRRGRLSTTTSRLTARVLLIFLFFALRAIFLSVFRWLVDEWRFDCIFLMSFPFSYTLPCKSTGRGRLHSSFNHIQTKIISCVESLDEQGSQPYFFFLSWNKIHPKKQAQFRRNFMECG